MKIRQFLHNSANSPQFHHGSSCILRGNSSNSSKSARVGVYFLHIRTLSSTLSIPPIPPISPNYARCRNLHDTCKHVWGGGGIGGIAELPRKTASGECGILMKLEELPRPLLYIPAHKERASGTAAFMFGVNSQEGAVRRRRTGGRQPFRCEAPACQRQPGGTQVSPRTPILEFMPPSKQHPGAGRRPRKKKPPRDF